jgi:hypothetical protein
MTRAVPRIALILTILAAALPAESRAENVTFKDIDLRFTYPWGTFSLNMPEIRIEGSSLAGEELTEIFKGPGFAYLNNFLLASTAKRIVIPELTFSETISEPAGVEAVGARSTNRLAMTGIEVDTLKNGLFGRIGAKTLSWGIAFGDDDKTAAGIGLDAGKTELVNFSLSDVDNLVGWWTEDDPPGGATFTLFDSAVLKDASLNLPQAPAVKVTAGEQRFGALRLFGRYGLKKLLTGNRPAASTGAEEAWRQRLTLLLAALSAGETRSESRNLTVSGTGADFSAGRLGVGGGRVWAEHLKTGCSTRPGETDRCALDIGAADWRGFSFASTVGQTTKLLGGANLTRAIAREDRRNLTRLMPTLGSIELTDVYLNLREETSYLTDAVEDALDGAVLEAALGGLSLAVFEQRDGIPAAARLLLRNLHLLDTPWNDLLEPLTEPPPTFDTVAALIRRDRAGRELAVDISPLVIKDTADITIETVIGNVRDTLLFPPAVKKSAKPPRPADAFRQMTLGRTRARIVDRGLIKGIARLVGLYTGLPDSTALWQLPAFVRLLNLMYLENVKNADALLAPLEKAVAIQGSALTVDIKPRGKRPLRFSDLTAMKNIAALLKRAEVTIKAE